MALGTSLFLIAVGAILKFAVTVHETAVNLKTVGVILMVVGAVGLVIWLFYTTLWANRTRGVAVDPVDAPVYRDPRLP